MGRRPQRSREHEPAPAVDGGQRLDDVTVGDRAKVELPFGEGAGLVEAQHVCASERLEDARVAHEHTLGRQTPRRARLRDRREERQPLGHSGRRETHAGGDCVAGTSAAQQGDAGERRARGEDQRHGSTGDVVEPRLDTGHRRGRTAGGSTTGLGAAAGRDHHGFGATGCDRSTGVGDRRSIGNRGFGGDRVDVLCDGERFTGEG